MHLFGTRILMVCDRNCCVFSHFYTSHTCALSSLSLSLSLSPFALSVSHTHARTLFAHLPKMAAASSIQPPSVHSSLAGESALSPHMDSPEGRRPEDEEAAAAQPPDSGTSLRELAELEPEEIERRLAKTRQELSNRRKILIKNLPPDTTNQVSLRWEKTAGKSPGLRFGCCFFRWWTLWV